MMDTAWVEDTLQKLTLEEKVSLLAGANFWETVAIERLGVPAVKVTDGPNGARGGVTENGPTAAVFPAGIALSSSWNPDLVREIGAALAEETRTKGANVLLAPTVNMHRGPLNGRNFECYSEDPELTTEIALAYIDGLQSNGIGATIKHFIGNESEYQRMTMSSDIDIRALREIYLPPFEAAVAAGVWAVMCSYNRLNGTFTSAHKWLLSDLLKDEYGFDGVAVSDWTAVKSTAESMNAGLDLEMPGPALYRGQALLDAIERGEVDLDMVTDGARRILGLVDRAGVRLKENPKEKISVDAPHHRALIRRAVAEGTVLLKNTGILPMQAGKKTQVAVIGPNADVARIMGGGSARVNAHYRVSPLEGLSARKELDIRFETGCANHLLLPVVHGPMTSTFYNSPDFTGPVAHEKQYNQSDAKWFGSNEPGVDLKVFSVRNRFDYSPSESGRHQLGLANAGLARLYVDDLLVVDGWDGWQPTGATYYDFGGDERIVDLDLEAGKTYRFRVDYQSTTGVMDGIQAFRVGVHRPLGEAGLMRAEEIAREAEVALLFVGRTPEWDSEGRDLPDLALPREQDELIARIAAVNPNTVVILQTGGPVAMPWKDDVAAILQAWYPGQELGHGLADVLLGDAEPGGRLPQTFPTALDVNPTAGNYPGENGHVSYGEGIFIGYRHYDARGGTGVLYPFGHGLSYTTFDIGAPVASASEIDAGGSVTVTVPVQNTGPRRGKAVVQLYVAPPQGRGRPVKELRGFRPLILEPGARSEARITLDMRDLAYFDVQSNAWTAPAGDYALWVGTSASDLSHSLALRLTADWTKPCQTAAPAA
ncbi:glycoside hydrolase family 3 protein [Phaeobacter sp. HF9A]|uniref:beta-glucosidase n=1 Tax=Phaeobacter sp. HF9A TaxID=2721561 RepID=UPI001C37DFF7|nr:glycoside hydrolase family 3 C-terminal domain-containing protein [Phaeobacter sp. HF9A]